MNQQCQLHSRALRDLGAPCGRSRRRGFSLLELIVVIILIGIIAAMAIPRMSRGTAGAASAALAQSLGSLRKAIDCYAAEHGGAFPAAANIADQLLQYTDWHGAVSAAGDTTYIYGPYLHKVPPLPVGVAMGNTGIAASPGAGVGWIYDAAAGKIKPNTADSEVDAAGTKYSDY